MTLGTTTDAIDPVDDTKPTKYLVDGGGGGAVEGGLDGRHRSWRDRSFVD